MKVQFICYPRCTTCAKARKWLSDAGIAYEERNIKTHNPTEAELRAWAERSGLPLRKFFNTSGQQYRSLGLKNKLSAMSADEQFELLSTDGMLVKRPILVAGDQVLVGFSAEEWAQRLTE